jgi:sugar lactone lactonase YvrE
MYDRRHGQRPIRPGSVTLLAALAAAVAGGWPACAGATTSQESAPGDVFVANIAGDNITFYDGTTGAPHGEFVTRRSGGLFRPTGLAFGPDGDLSVSSSGNGRILRFDGETGAFDAVVIDDDVLERPFSLAFGPDGMLYVSSLDRVLRYDVETGAFAGVAAAAEELRQPIGLAFGPDGQLYVANSGGASVMRFDASGTSLGVFASDSLRYPSDVAFGPDGRLHVSSAATRSVVRFAPDGSFDRVVARLPERAAPVGIAFAPDGRLIVGDFAGNRLFAATERPDEPFLLSDEALRGPENIAFRRR